MSAAMVTTASPPATGEQLFTGTPTLLRFALRLDRLRLAIWVLAVGGLTVYTSVALTTVYPTAADRQARAEVISTPAGVLLSGPGFGIHDYTLGAMIANELSLSVMVAAAIMSIQLVVRHTRAEEESGRAELVRAGIVGRRAPLTAALLEAALADLAVAAVIAAGLIGSGLAPVDSLALATAIGLTGLLFGAVAAVTAQLTAHARAASGSALAVLALAAVVRGVGDLLHEGGSLLSWWSPIAWAQQTRAFVDLRWTPLLLSVVALTALVVGAYRLVGIRDVGAGLVAPQPGPPGATPALSGVTGLTVRLQRASVISWAVALLLSGAMFGSLVDAVADMVAGNARLAAVVRAAGGDVTDGFLAATSLYLGIAVGAFAVASVLRMHAEESAGRVEVVLTTAVHRGGYFDRVVGVTAVAATMLLVVGGLGAGVTAAAVRGDAGLVLSQLGAQLVQLPAVLVMTGLAAAVVGLTPRLVAAAWVVVAWVVVVGFFGVLLDLPSWARHLSPFAWLPQVPAEPLEVLPLVALTALAVVLFRAGQDGFRWRDVPA
jgi:ABC-2 type transport system permease protein